MDYDNQNVMTTTKKRSFDDIIDTDDDNATYIIPVSFDSFKCMLQHYETCVEPLESSGQGHKWKQHLTKAEKKGSKE